MELEVEQKLESKLLMQPSYYAKGKMSSPREMGKMLNRGFWVTEVFDQKGNMGNTP